jgi:hypothetical protein
MLSCDSAVTSEAVSVTNEDYSSRYLLSALQMHRVIDVGEFSLGERASSIIYMATPTSFDANVCKSGFHRPSSPLRNIRDSIRDSI